MLLILAHQSSLCTSLCKVFLASSRSTLPPILVSSVNLLRVGSIPLFISSINILNRTGLNTDHWSLLVKIIEQIICWLFDVRRVYPIFLTYNFNSKIGTQ